IRPRTGGLNIELRLDSFLWSLLCQGLMLGTLGVGRELLSTRGDASRYGDRYFLPLKIHHATQTGVRLAIHFHPAANDQIRPHVRGRLEVEVPALGPFHAILIQAAKPIRRL